MKNVITLLLLIILTGCTRTSVDVDYLAVGQDYLARSEYDEALTEFRRGIDEEPNNNLYSLAIADIYLKKGNQDEAIGIINSSFQLNPHEKTANALGEIYLNIGDVESSTEWFEKALTLNDKYTPSLRGKAKTLALAGKVEETTRFINELPVESLDSNLMLMKAIVSLDNPTLAGEYILKSTSLDEDTQELAKELRVALTANEENPNLHYSSTIVYILLNHGWYEFARVPLAKIITENPFYETAYIYQGLINLNTSQLDMAKENFQKSLEINSEGVDSIIFLIQTEFLKGENEAALQRLSELTTNKLEKLNAQQLFTLLDILYKQDEFVSFDTIYSTIPDESQVPANTKIKYLKVLVGLEKYEQANSFYQDEFMESKDLKAPEIAVVEILNAYTLFKLNLTDDALDKVAKAEAADDTVAMVHLHKGLIFIEMEEFSKAKVALDRAVELDLEGSVTIDAKKGLEIIPL